MKSSTNGSQSGGELQAADGRQIVYLSLKLPALAGTPPGSSAKGVPVPAVKFSRAPAIKDDAAVSVYMAALPKQLPGRYIKDPIAGISARDARPGSMQVKLR